MKINKFGFETTPRNYLNFTEMILLILIRNRIDINSIRTPESNSNVKNYFSWTLNE